MLQMLINHPLDERGQRGMEGATVECSFENQDDRHRRRHRDLYRQNVIKKLYNKNKQEEPDKKNTTKS